MKTKTFFVGFFIIAFLLVCYNSCKRVELENEE